MYLHTHFIAKPLRNKILRLTLVYTFLIFTNCSSDENDNTKSEDLNVENDTIPSSKPEGVLFYDSFELGTMSATNTDNFQWGQNNKTSIVTKESVVWNNGEINNSKPDDGRDWITKDGTYGLRFRYPAGEPWAEQRFNMGAPQKELWLRYWIRVPENYTHGSGDGGAGDARNNKFISIWMDEYQGDGSTFWLSMESAGDGNTSLAFTYNLGSDTGSLAYQQYTPFINADTDKGKWMQIVIHLKAESTEGADDGIVETWRRWESETEFTKFHEKFDVPFKIPNNGPNGFQKGYLLGWANGTYLEDTEWLIDAFTLSTKSLLE